MGKRKVTDMDHSTYVDRSQTSRSHLTMMTKIRSAQSLGSVFCGRGMHKRAFDLYKNTINEIFTDDVRINFTNEQLNMLRNALNQAEEMKDDKERAWRLRSNIDSVYDSCINTLNEVETQQPASFHTQIKDTINAASPYITSGNFHEGLSKYTLLLRRLAANTKFRQLLSRDSQNLIAHALEQSENSDDIETSVKKMRESVDRVYNEIRLPDIYSPSTGPQKPVNSKDVAKRMKNSLLMIDFRQKDGSLFPYKIQCVDDKIMGGSSDSNVELDEAEKYLRFDGEVSRTNRGGFASFRILPEDKDSMRKILSDVKSIELEVKNLTNRNRRYKFQLANEAHLKSFNWQSEFIIEPGQDFQRVYLDVLTFWPTMFGHVLSYPGNVDFQKVDCLGIIISHVTVDGKENPDFEPGDFGLAVRSISLIKET